MQQTYLFVEAQCELHKDVKFELLETRPWILTIVDDRTLSAVSSLVLGEKNWIIRLATGNLFYNSSVGFCK